MFEHKNCQIICDAPADVRGLTNALTVRLGVEYCYVDHSENWDCRRGFNSDSQKIACFEGEHHQSWIIHCELTGDQIEALKNVFLVGHILYYAYETWNWERA